ncbi:MAG: protein translocase subunit SecD [Phycisphaerales bacterium]
MQNLIWKFVLIAVVLAVCGTTVAFRKPSLGRDLRGGVSLIYAVDIPENATQSPEEILTQTITSLQDRVNPQGVIDIQMEPLGRDRIQITMPLPTPEIQALKQKAEDAIRALMRDSEIDRFSLRSSLAEGLAVDRFGGTSGGTRQTLIRDLQAAWNEQAAARAAFDALDDGAGEDAQLRAGQDVALAELAYDDAERGALELSLDEARLRRMLALPNAPEPEKDSVTGRNKVDDKGEVVMGPSRREVALAALKNDFPDLADRLDGVVGEWETYQSQVTGFDDPEDLKRLLKGAGVLEFRIAVDPADPAGVDIDAMRQQLEDIGPANALSGTARWFPINRIDQWYDTPAEFTQLTNGGAPSFFAGRRLVGAEYDGQYYLLLSTTVQKSIDREGGQEWSLSGASRSQDSLGRPAVAFTLDGAGARLMGRLTTRNLGSPMAIVLDGEVYSAPTVQGQITSNGQITGQFSDADISYLIRVLAAGSLAAKLGAEPISVSVLGPSIGADNLSRGREAFIISIIVVAVFMLIYYLLAGVVAVIALAANGTVIFGALMLIDGTFTLPGLAGIVLTVGMAVDANVLIYERIREEMFAGELDLRGCIRQGYGKALSTILDANITNLIVCVVLFQTATTEVKGFALTLTLGICATLFTALFMTRQIFLVFTEILKIKNLPMLPVVFPSIHRALEPNIDWIGKRKFFWVLSVIGVTTSLVLVSSRGVDMLDTEFRGGVSLKIATVPMDEDRDGVPDTDALGQVQRVLIPHTGDGGVEATIRGIGDGVSGDAEDRESKIRRQFGKAQVLTVGRTESADDGTVRAGEFQIKIAAPEGMEDDDTITDFVVGEIVRAMGDRIDVNPIVTFTGAGENDSTQYATAITTEDLSDAVRVDVNERVPAFVGGVAIVLEDLSPPVPAAEILRRIERMREQPDQRDTAGRRTQIVPVEVVDPENPLAGVRSAVVLVHDPAVSYVRADIAPEVWRSSLADREWRLVGLALEQPESLDEVNSYSSAVAQTLKANATVAVILSLIGILVYIWVRFGSLRYSLAAITALVHDVILSLGLLALSTIVGVTAFGATLLIEPFRIDLGVVAALLTIIGYSLNDTIVILDRVRENRGKMPLASAETINRSINQTVSRTLLTSFTTLVAVAIMYAEGGSGIRPFTFCLLAGLLVGTYSSVGIAAPMVYAGKEATEKAARLSAGRKAKAIGSDDDAAGA